MRPVNVKPNGPYIRRFLTQTDEYNFIVVDFRTDKYNLNIFMVPMNDIFCSVTKNALLAQLSLSSFTFIYLYATTHLSSCVPVKCKSSMKLHKG
jgi:hypothetical protein